MFEWLLTWADLCASVTELTRAPLPARVLHVGAGNSIVGVSETPLPTTAPVAGHQTARRHTSPPPMRESPIVDACGGR